MAVPVQPAWALVPRAGVGLPAGVRGPGAEEVENHRCRGRVRPRRRALARFRAAGSTGSARPCARKVRPACALPMLKGYRLHLYGAPLRLKKSIKRTRCPNRARAAVWRKIFGRGGRMRAGLEEPANLSSGQRLFPTLVAKGAL